MDTCDHPVDLVEYIDGNEICTQCGQVMNQAAVIIDEFHPTAPSSVAPRSSSAGNRVHRDRSKGQLSRDRLEFIDRLCTQLTLPRPSATTRAQELMLRYVRALSPLRKLSMPEAVACACVYLECCHLKAPVSIIQVAVAGGVNLWRVSSSLGHVRRSLEIDDPLLRHVEDFLPRLIGLVQLEDRAMETRIIGHALRIVGCFGPAVQEGGCNPVIDAVSFALIAFMSYPGTIDGVQSRVHGYLNVLSADDACAPDFILLELMTVAMHIGNASVLKRIIKWAVLISQEVRMPLVTRDSVWLHLVSIMERIDAES